MGFDSRFDRSSGVGASNTHKAVRGSPHLLLQKRTEREKPLVPYVKPFEGNEATELGNEEEPSIIRWGAKKSGVVITDTDPTTLRHPAHDFIFATVDAIGISPWNGEKTVCEAKLVGIGPHHDWGAPSDGWEALPYKVQCQIAIQMAVHDTEDGWVFARIGTTTKVYHVRRDREFEQELIDAVGEFWQDVLDMKEPEPGWEDAIKQYYNKKYSKTNGEEFKSEKAGELILRREQLYDEEKAAKNNRLTVENELRLLIAEHDSVVSSVGRASYSFDRNGRRVLRVKAFKEAQA